MFFESGSSFSSAALRSVMAAGTAFSLVLLLGPRVIAFLRAKKIGDRAAKGDSAALDAMHASKNDTPTMGGILIVLGAITASAVFARVGQFPAALVLCAIATLSLVGFVDDHAKLTTRGRGLRPRTKLLLCTAVGLAIGMAILVRDGGLEGTAQADSVRLGAAGVAGVSAQARHELAHDEPDAPMTVRLPFARDRAIPLGALFIVFAMIVVVSTTNAVNFTDGLDGLAAGSAALALLPFVAVACAAGDAEAARTFGFVHVRGAGEAGVVGAAVTGATLGFLWFNTFPARVFMGDTGSLALGGALSALALTVREELLLVIAGGVFVIEGMSVLLQVLAFKTTGKRIFAIAPIHHAFRFRGVEENHVTIRFWIVGALCAALAFASLL